MKPRLGRPPLNIMVAVDGSEHSRAAVTALRDLPLCESAPPGSSIAVLAVMIPRDASENRARELLLEETKAQLSDMCVPVSTELLVGYPSEVLAQYAESHHPDLIVLGAKGLRATLGILLGGVAQAMVEYTGCPVLVVRAPYRGWGRILLAVDGSLYGQRAMKYLADFPLPAGAEVQVVHVLPPISIRGIYRYGPMGTPGVFQEASPEVEEEAARMYKEEEGMGQTILTEAVETLHAAGKKASSTLLRGDAATEIIDQVKQNQVELIVAGSRGLNAMRGWLLGSVSRKLVHYAGCSVLVVKGPLLPGELTSRQENR